MLTPFQAILSRGRGVPQFFLHLNSNLFVSRNPMQNVRTRTPPSGEKVAPQERKRGQHMHFVQTKIKLFLKSKGSLKENNSLKRDYI
jgi:hypothetical protein